MSYYPALHATLVIAQEQRHSFADPADWILYERLQMLRGVNRLRYVAGKPPLPSSEVEEQERMACGHSDYTKKFALGCAELVAKP